jgi:hypothetical protein
MVLHSAMNEYLADIEKIKSNKFIKNDVLVKKMLMMVEAINLALNVLTLGVWIKEWSEEIPERKELVIGIILEAYNKMNYSAKIQFDCGLFLASDLYMRQAQTMLLAAKELGYK